MNPNLTDPTRLYHEARDALKLEYAEAQRRFDAQQAEVRAAFAREWDAKFTKLQKIAGFRQ